MGSSCSAGSEKGRSLSDPGRSKASNPSKERKRAFSMTSSSAVNLHVEASLNPETGQSEPAVPTKEPPDKLEPSSETVLEPELKAPSVTSSIPTPVRPARSSQVSMESKHVSMEEYPKYVQNLLLGNINQFHDERPRVIRLYIAACDSDSRVERLAIMRHVVQPLSDLCYKRRFSLEFLDPHWLGNNPSTYNHTYLPHELLKGNDHVPTIILIMLNDKLGSALPWVLTEKVFHHVTSGVTNDDERQLIESLYLRLDGQQNVVYQLTVSECCRDQSGGITRSYCPDCYHKMAKLEELLKRYMAQEDRHIYLKSGLEREITFAVEQSGVPPDNLYVVCRTFTDISGVSKLYMDVTGDSPDEESSLTIERMREKVVNNVPISNQFNFDVKWTSDDLDPVNVPEHARYVEGLCNKLRTELSQRLTSIINSHSPTVLPQNVPDRLYQEAAAHTSLCQHLQDICPSTLPFLDKVSRYACSSSNPYPLVLEGETGMDTHAIAARVSTLPFEKDMATIIRYLGLTPESKSVSGMFSGISEQLGLMYSKIAVEKNQECFHELLKNATEQRPLLLVLGEITQLLGTWIPLELPHHVKVIVLSSEDKVIEELRSRFPTECFIKIPSSSNDAKSETLHNVNKLLSKDDTDSSTVILGQSYAAVNSLRKELFCDLSSFSMTSAAGEHSKSDAFNNMCECLESNFSQILVSKIFNLLLLTKSGLCSFHLAVIVSQDEDALKVLKLTDPVQAVHTLLLLWSEMKTLLRPFLHEFTFNGILLHVLFNSKFRKLLAHRYRSSNAKGIHQRMCAFCDSIDCDVDNEHAKHPFYLSSLDLFLYLEYPYHYEMCSKGNFREKFVFCLEWLERKIASTSTLCVLEDIRSIKDPEVQFLYRILALSADALDVSISQIASQFVCRLLQEDMSKFKNIDKMLTDCKSKDGAYFATRSPCFRSATSDVSDEIPTDVLCGLFWPPSHTQCVISLSQERGEIVLWDIETQKPIRTLQGVDRPHDLKMVDSYRAVVLCNRELKIYNLNTGCLETSLRGVLNLKTPMFGVKNEESVITVSRNRMYINVLDIASGDTSATFKAGEDRFLNSLVISKNGKILVCGDETQKPSPLLVWELEESRLLHDLRMQQHEFITSISDITDDGHYVVCACQELCSSSPNFLVVYDLVSGQVFKIWKWEQNVTCVAVHSGSKCVVSGLETGDVIVWDLVSGNARFHMKGVCSVCNRIELTSHDRCITWYNGESTLAQARTVCVWDIKKGVRTACITLDARPSCCSISPRGDTVVLGLPGYDKIVTFTLKVEGADQSNNSETSYGDPANKGVIFQV